VVRSFCAQCGTSLAYESKSRPGEVDLTQGSLDDPSGLGVTGRIWTADAARWEATAHALPTARAAGPVAGPPFAHPVRTWFAPAAEKGRESSIQGRGAFAVAAIGAGQVVAIKGGHVVDRATLEALPEKLKNSEIGIAKGLHLVALSESEYDDVMLFFNHSCEPNVGVRGNVAFVAMRDIPPGEELTIDYAMIDDHEDESMTCRCGTASCRGVIRGRDFRLPELRHRYGRFLSAYLLDQLDAESPPP
jgi:hypothetical protein